MACGSMLAAFARVGCSVSGGCWRCRRNRGRSSSRFLRGSRPATSRVSFALRLDPLSALDDSRRHRRSASLIHVCRPPTCTTRADSEYARYFSYLNLFAAFMLVLVLGSNFLVMFVGWEGVGLVLLPADWVLVSEEIGVGRR